MGSVASVMLFTSDLNHHENHMHNGGCLEEFKTAIDECRPAMIQRRRDRSKRAVDGDACIKATAALRECCGRNPLWFQHQYITRLDSGLDEDLKPTPEQIEKEEHHAYRWWTGMRRS